MNTSTLAQIISGTPEFFYALGVKDIIDLGIAAFFIYLILIFVKQTRSYFIIGPIAFLFGINYLSTSFNLGLTRQIFQPLLTFFIVIFVVVFQREIRRFFEWFSVASRRLAYERKAGVTEGASLAIARALMHLAHNKVGALVVFAGEQPLEGIVDGGFVLDGRISTPLLLSIFDPSSPGHDGAIIIENNRVRRFGVHLPLAENFKKFNEYGTRHRAAVGITEKTDALTLVVSEERGSISMAEEGELKLVPDQETLVTIIETFLKENIPLAESPWHNMLWKNVWAKIAAILLSACLWFIFVYQTGVTTQEFAVPVEFRNIPKTLVIEDTDQSNVTVILSGSYRDFINFEPARDLKVTIDASVIKKGSQRLNISRENVSAPSYFTLLSTSPSTIRITVSEASAENLRATSPN